MSGKRRGAARDGEGLKARSQSSRERVPLLKSRYSGTLPYYIIGIKESHSDVHKIAIPANSTLLFANLREVDNSQTRSKGKELIPYPKFIVFRVIRIKAFCRIYQDVVSPLERKKKKQKEYPTEKFQQLLYFPKVRTSFKIELIHILQKVPVPDNGIQNQAVRSSRVVQSYQSVGV